MSKRAKRTPKEDQEAIDASDSGWKWKEETGIISGDCGTKPSEKILAMDMDGTIIKTKSNAKFAKDANDWEFLNDKTISKIKSYHDKGYKVVIITNQGGIEAGKTKKSDIMTKIQNIAKSLGISIQAIISPNKDGYHKPAPGMWSYFTKNMNGSIKADLAQSYYIGDAAGRPKIGKRPADFDNTDYKFALNVGLIFKTPENFYFDEKDNLPELELDLKIIPKTGSVFKGKTDPKIKSGSKEMIIFVGSPGSGKSTFWKNHLSDYVRVNNDTLKSKSKCHKVAEEAMAQGKSLVIDNTNPNKAVRKEYIELAKANKYPVRCFYFELPKELAFHNNNQRKMNPHRNHLSGSVPSMIIHGFYKNSELPSKDEGFESVELINFVAGPFENQEDEQLFYSHVSSKH